MQPLIARPCACERDILPISVITDIRCINVEIMKVISCLTLFILTLVTIDPCSAAPRYTLNQQWPRASFSKPLDLQFVQVRGEDLALVVEQGGRIVKVPVNSDGSTASTLLDISSLLVNSGEQGLLGLALHPRFLQNGFLFVNYSRASDGATVIARFTVNLETMTSDSSSEVRILEVLQPFSNHNGGSLTFGSDGLLYIPTGDGGGAGDPENNGQSLSSLLGKILRIDVNTTDNQTRYTIPPSNPFANRGTGVMPEIFAYGLRNPFKVTRDTRSGRIWIADVGQGMREEVNVLRRGANYGWPIMEGELCFRTGLPCSIRRLQKPVWTIPHPKGSSITGGYVYRGAALRRLSGSYIYGDFITGRMWRLATQGRRYSNRLLLSTKLNISSFGQDLSGEIYVVDYSGNIFRLVGS